jgi:hypothetical protein
MQALSMRQTTQALHDQHSCTPFKCTLLLIAQQALTKYGRESECVLFRICVHD